MLGPPGTGKTTYLTRQIMAARERYDMRSVMVVSFTRTAAAEIMSRINPDEDKKKKKDKELAARVGTLHSICFHLLDRPKIAETKIGQWNAVVARPDQITGSKGAGDDPEWSQTDNNPGDAVMAQISTLRAQMVDPAVWPTRPKLFYDKWRRWKDDNGYIDFTDMIEICLKQDIPPPKGVRIAILDEAQDSTLLELTLLRKWSRHFEKFIVAYDDDQALFTWRGATPANLINTPIADANRRVLSQSYRVPRVVHAYANAWIQKVTARASKPYLPRDEEGQIGRNHSTFKHVQPLISVMNEEIAAGRTFMCLASCAFMLNPMISKLRDLGIPFHNPFRVTNGQWNPLRQVQGSTSYRLNQYLKRNEDIHGSGARLHLWSAKDLYLWAEHLSAAAFAYRGAKSILKKLAKDTPDDLILEEEYFKPEYQNALNLSNLEWFQSMLLGTKTKSYRYPIQIVKRDPKLLTKKPSVVVGTIHSCKGGESDVVSIWPDLSASGYTHWTSASGRDDVLRMFYVAFTRARERLILGSKRGSSSILWGL